MKLSTPPEPAANELADRLFGTLEKSGADVYKECPSVPVIIYVATLLTPVYTSLHHVEEIYPYKLSNWEALILVQK